MTVNNKKKQQVIKTEGHQIENGEKFKYLGSIMNKEGSTEKDIEMRIANAQSAFHMLNRI
jgi:predicted adenine nucleotide alpha hydrolase (AANH) superfamily ATPase